MIKQPRVPKLIRTRVRKNVQQTSNQARTIVNKTSVSLASATTTNANRSALLQAVRHAHDLWRMQAKFKNITINAVSAIGTPGCLDGPDLDILIARAPTVVTMPGSMGDLRDAVAEGVDACFENWQDHVTVPGLPWYPAFVAFPGPMAPPMPNVPFPLIALASSGMAKITSQAQLKQAIGNALPAGLKTTKVEDFISDISLRLSIYFLRWLASQTVTQVLGKGPVPTFAPPYVPVGPVVGGTIISTPGHLSNGALPMIV